MQAGPLYTKTVDTNQVLGLVIKDLAQFNEFDRQFQRYIWLVPWGPKEAGQAVNFVINSCVNGVNRRVIVPPYMVTPFLMRYDLRYFATNEVELVDIIQAFDEVSIQDYRFYTVQEIEAVNEDDIFRGVVQEGANALNDAQGDFEDAIEQAVEQIFFIVTEDQAAIKNKSTTLGFASAGQRLLVQRQEGDWFYVTTKDGSGKEIKGWIHTASGRTVTAETVKRLEQQEAVRKRNNRLQIVGGENNINGSTAEATQTLGEKFFDVDIAFGEKRTTNIDFTDLDFFGGRAAVNDIEVIDQQIVLAPHLAVSYEVALSKLLKDFQLIPFVVSSDVFITLATTTLDGGKYYDLMLFKQNGQFVVDRDDIFAALGADINDINNQVRAFQMYSKVTGKRRIVILIQGRVARINTGAIWVSVDIFDEDNAADNDFLFNLIDAVADAQEIIFELPNGLHGFLLSNAAGDLVDSVPEDVACDNRIPSPGTLPRGGGSGTKILEPALSCIRCHADGSGLKDVTNDIYSVIKLNVLDDNALAQVEDDLVQRIETLFALYGIHGLEGVNEPLGKETSGAIDRRVRLGRDDYEFVTQKVTAGLTVPQIAKITSDI